MAQHGGYREPSDPAPVSGPGALSARTDGGPGQPVRELPNAAYGEGGEFRALQEAAPLAGGNPPPRPAPVPLTAATERPLEPVTHGAPVGPGAGPEVSGFPQTRVSDLLARLMDADPTGQLEDLYMEAYRRGL